MSKLLKIFRLIILMKPDFAAFREVPLPELKKEFLEDCMEEGRADDENNKYKESVFVIYQYLTEAELDNLINIRTNQRVGHIIEKLLLATYAAHNPQSATPSDSVLAEIPHGVRNRFEQEWRS